MTSKEALELLVRNMEVKEKNLEGIIEASQESLMKAVNDSTTRGEDNARKFGRTSNSKYQIL